MCKTGFSRGVFLALLVAVTFASLMSAVSGQAQTFSVVGILPSTNGQITYPAAEQITQGRNGDVYALSEANGGIFGASTSGTFAEVDQTYLGNGVVLGTDGNFYSNQHYCGGVVKTTPSGTSSLIATLCGSDGSGPFSVPIQAPNGHFYGTTTDSYTSGSGTIYSMSSTGALSLLHTFVGTDGSFPTAPLAVGSDGNLYGGTTAGGTNNDGVLFRITPSGTYTVLHNFAGTDGKNVTYGLCPGSDGNLYGVTQNGGTDNDGVVFKLTTSGAYTVLYNMLNPYSLAGGSLIQATDGKLYGILAQGNGSQPGWIYSVTTSGTFAILHEFCQQTNCTDGIAPSTPLIQHTNGKLYGFTVHGGDTSVCSGNGCGVFYSFDVGLKAFATLVTASGKVGSKIGILGQGFSASSVVKFNGVASTSVGASGTKFLQATVPAGASDGFVTVTTGTTTLTSSQKFIVHDSWGTGAAMPTAVYGAAIGELDNKIYVVGGYSSETVANTQIYNPATNAWSAGVALPTATDTAASAVVANVLYVIGGSSSLTGKFTNAVWAFNPSTKTWSSKAAMPTTRNGARAVVEGGIIYVMGGYNGTTFINTVESYNPATDSWTEEAPMLATKDTSAAGLMGSTIVVADGSNVPGSVTGDAEGYNSKTNTWTSLTADPTARTGPCNGVIGGVMYDAAGYTNNGGAATTVNESFSLSADKWTTTLAPMPLGTMFGGSVVGSGQLYCFGGEASVNGSPVSNVQIYQP
jgi:uncharacterized repeat protein (TIGR03803 family)